MTPEQPQPSAGAAARAGLCQVRALELQQGKQAVAQGPECPQMGPALTLWQSLTPLMVLAGKADVELNESGFAHQINSEQRRLGRSRLCVSCRAVPRTPGDSGGQFKAGSCMENFKSLQ